MLLGRDSECQALDDALADALAGRSRVIVLRGEAGIGKTALLDFVSGRLDGWQVTGAVGLEAELELAYSGLHQICSPMLDRLERIPRPQRDALATVFGLIPGAPANRFLVGLATLTLFAEIAEQRPFAIIVDDAQWLDQASEQVLGFVARRLLAERIAIVCAARTGIGDDVLVALPELPIIGLHDTDARSLLLGSMVGPIDAAVLQQIITESQGNPLALIELGRLSSVVDFAGGFGVPGGKGVTEKIERTYARRLEALPSQTRLLLLLASPSRAVTDCSSTGLRRSSGSKWRLSSLPWMQASSKSIHRSRSHTPSHAPSPTTTPTAKTGISFMPRWQKQPTSGTTPIGTRGIGPALRQNPTRKSRPSLSSRRCELSHEAGSPQQRPFLNERSC